MLLVFMSGVLVAVHFRGSRLPVPVFTHTHTQQRQRGEEVVMDAQETVIGEVIGQFYSFFGGLMNLRDTLANISGVSQSVRQELLDQLAELEGE